MNQDKRPTLKRPDILFLSFFGVGYSRFAPGTCGTLATLPFLYFLGRFNPPFFLFIPFVVILTFISSFIAEKVQTEFKLHDPGWIVIDEVLGMTVTWLFSIKYNFTHLLVQFILFRLFDIVKIFPASYFDKKVTHGYGTIVDDIISGIYAGILYLIISNFLKL